MEIRKLVKSGQSSYTVALPKCWIDKNKLHRGDDIYIEEKTNNELVVSTDMKKQSHEKTKKIINVDKKEYYVIYREIIRAYLDNYYEIIIKGSEIQKHLQKIKKLIYDLVAFEVIDESSTSVVARSFLNYEETSVEKLLRRIDNIARSMLTDTIQSIHGESLVDAVEARDYDVNRLNYLILKILKLALQQPEIAKSIHLSTLGMMSYWQVSLHLEKVADEFKAIARLVDGANKKKIDTKKLEALLNELDETYKSIMTGFYTDVISHSDQICIKRPELTIRCDKYFAENKTYEVSEITARIKAV
ncbi:hypothetical protein COV93_02000, partial [Candidatus Woesearchaeota archaeon CG11_big_fil_rev_8_21_14_0_20_43_8]